MSPAVIEFSRVYCNELVAVVVAFHVAIFAPSTYSIVSRI